MPVLSNPRHERFAQELASGKTADEAYSLAGFSPNRGNATRLKANESVASRVAELQGNAAERVELSRSWVLARLVENVDRAMQATEVLDREGEGTGEYRYEGNVANRALELLGKEIGMFVDRKEVRTGKLDAIDDEQLDNLISAVERAIATGVPFQAEVRTGEAAERKPH